MATLATETIEREGEQFIALTPPRVEGSVDLGSESARPISLEDVAQYVGTAVDVANVLVALSAPSVVPAGVPLVIGGIGLAARLAP